MKFDLQSAPGEPGLEKGQEFRDFMKDDGHAQCPPKTSIQKKGHLYKPSRYLSRFRWLPCGPSPPRCARGEATDTGLTAIEQRLN